MAMPLQPIAPPLTHRARRAAAAWMAAGSTPSIVGESPAITRVLDEVRQLSHTDAKVLITGESGTGKELVASFVHSTSRRADRPFVAVNCAGMPETLLESELFGHVKGSFTGAYHDRPGRFEAACTGTLFLDEVGEMTLRMQGLLLRVLETGEVQKVGADRITVRTDVRVLAATNRNLAEMVQQGLFREDLFYRLNVIHVHVPPLRERPEDIPLLADFLLDRAAKTCDHDVRFAPDVYPVLQAWHWPGNVRQLDNIVQRLAIGARDGIIRVQDLPAEIRGIAPGAPVVPPKVERRRTAGDLLYDRITGGASFWDVVYAPYVEHNITRDDVRTVVRKGLESARGNYRIVTKLFNIPRGDYKRFLNFLRTHDCLLPWREFR